MIQTRIIILKICAICSYICSYILHKKSNEVLQEQDWPFVSFSNLKSLYFIYSHLFSFVVPLPVIRCHSLSFVITGCHSLSLFVFCCHSFSLDLSLTVIRCHSLSFIVTGCTFHCHSLSLVVILCHSMYPLICLFSFLLCT